MPITALYAGLLAIWLVVLSFRVISGRWAGGISIGVGDDPMFERRVRAQANLIEYAPLALICLALLENAGVPPYLLHGLGLILLLGRVAHGMALSFNIGGRPARAGGAAATFAVLLLAAAGCVWVYLTA